mmetsp:Transcript_27719/g.42701  ORF Transcript_27719/g.42701 Transcript_27719/m.42701 type:complete len:241 (-) Transcript_27719:85-807(-)|eukprot:CAMPEP_0117017958 /NCGR_PEP_ID=MMETSP0472-20121206/13940_1 /TAXON_ID=693140 ORGANISM="Tiarina fusus, Strain LIS" /NCGR_SAMPLE_ID=MMETSP0472 /ASSEMBLY_ACC=CAM_ASM_000603 /LENGTH=240 /DNA_ID=CAMNT_0004722451 /DNA_START=42 /DNA_END=764 /DNA_ORIENTATION=+
MPPARFNKKGKGKKKTVDPFEKKDWYNIKAPRMFATTAAGVTPVNRTQGNNIASDNLKGRVLIVNLAELQGNEKYAHTNVKLKVDEIQGKHCLTNFYGLSYTTDKLKSLVKKWQTLVEGVADAKTTDGYNVRMFCVGFTKPRNNQISKACYAQTSKVKQIRAKMVAVMSKEASSGELKDLVKKLISNQIGEAISRQVQGIYPMRDVGIRKVKILKAPRYDPVKLLELHGDVKAAGKKVKA